MKLSIYASASLVAGALLLASSFPLAQATWVAGSKRPHNAAAGQSSGSQAQPGARNVQQYRKAEDMHTRYRSGNIQNNATSVHSNAVDQTVVDSTQRKDGSIVHADYPKSTDRNSAHATESLRTSDKAGTGGNPLHEAGGKSGTNPLYESGKQQSAEAQNRKHLGNMKYQDRMSGGGNGTPGMAVNEQGSSKAPARRRH